MARRPSRRKPANRSTPSYRRVAVLIAVAIVTSATVNAQSVPTGVQEYYVLGWEQHIWDMMDRVQNAQGGAQFADGMNSVVTATASADNQVVYYDHWEDGPDTELDNFPTVDPTALQSSTVVIGDGDTGNGQLCDFNANATCGIDIISAGDYINFNSDLGLGCTASDCSVPLNPRDPADIHFDGGDLIKTTGGPLTLIHSQYPLTNYIGGSIEILSRQAVEAARSYSVPIGEDLYAGGTPTEPFHYVELELVAFEDTSITVDSPGAGSVSFTLGRGEHWSSMGYINDSAFPALELTINAGTKVSTTAPISGLIFTGGDGTWATRLYTLLPDILHSTDYVTTAPGDDPAGGPTTNGTPQNRPANVYILNPDLLTDIDVQITDETGSYTVTIPANSMRSMDDIGAGRDIAPDSTVRMTSDRNFWGVTAYDYNTNISDWGHSWLAKKFLTNFYTVSFGPGNQNQPPDGSQYGNPVFVAATADRTRVQFDLDNDGVFDVVDLDGDGGPDASPYADNTYEVDMLAALRVTDPGDNDMTGTRIVANKPVAASWGQDTDRSYYNDQALDTGFTIYPVNQLFLDPALTVDKEVDTTAVPTGSVDADRIVTYTLTVRSYGFGPLNEVEVWDVLPAGVVADDTAADSDYVHGSTLITCPNLVQGTSDPEFADCTGGDGVDCGRLSWDIEGACVPPTPFTLGTNKTLTVRYQVVIPEAPSGPRLLTNTGHAQATLGGSVFSPSDIARVVQTDVVFTKTVDKQTLPAGDVLTFNLTVENTGASAESNVFISDPIPVDTTFVPGSIEDDGAFDGSGVYDASQNAVVWSAASFAPGPPATLSFQVRVNPTVPAGTEIPNRGGYESDETPYFLSNEVDPVVLGPALDALKTIVGNPTVVHPNERVTFEIVIENTGTAAATNVFLRDAFPSNAAYAAGTIRWSLNSAPFTTLTDANDGDEGGGADGRAFADRIEFRLASLGPSQNVAVRFDMTVDAGTAGQFLIDQAVFASDATPSTDTNLVQVPIVGDATLTGHVFLDLDANGIQDAGEPNLSSVDVVIIDAGGVVQRVSTDANGDYLVTVEAGTATANVDETDADFPTNATLTTAAGCSNPPAPPCNDPQTVTAVSGATVAAADVGYDPPPLTFSKTSDAVDHEVSPGDTITYTLSAVNATGVTQTGVTVTDPLPTGTAAVDGSTSMTVTNPVFRVSEYVIPAGAFTGTAYDLTLGQDLVADYFVIIQGSDNTGNQDRGPDADYARLTRDPFASGDLAASGATNLLRLERGAVEDDWEGVVTVVECLSACDTAGFRLRSVEAVAHTGTSENGTDAVTGGWNDIDQVLLMGGFNGAGCTTTEGTDRNHPVCHARLYPEENPGDLIHWTRDGSNGDVDLGDAVSTVMVVEWGSEWSVQRSRVTGTNGGNGLDTTGEYNTAALNPSVTRGETWVWGTGHADGQGVGDQAEGVAYTLGDGVNQGASEISVAAGTEYNGTAVDFEIYVMSHPDLAVDYRFKADGDNGSATVDVTVDSAGGQRMAVASNGQGATDDNYPRPLFSARYLNDTTVRLERQRTGETFPAWVEGIDFTGIVGLSTFPGGNPQDLVTIADHAVSLGPSGTIEVTFKVVVDPDLDPAATPQITNTATLDTAEESPLQASVTDDVVEVGVVVEYDNAGFGLTGDTVTYFHEVVNRGSGDDAFVISLAHELHWPVELVDPDTGGVIASDTDGDGAWDGGVVVNTGSLAAGEAAQYILRIRVTGGEGSAESTSLIATSERDPGVSARATDETVAIGSLDPATHPVIVLPDNSGVAEIGGTAVYSHRVLNNTGATDTFDLTGWSELGWDFTFYWDADGNGVYSDGVDVAITNTLQLADGASQLFFVVVEAISGGDNTQDVLHIAASSRKNYDEFFGTATDTTTISPPTILDLSGGGTRTVTGGDTAVFPGTIYNMTEVEDTYNFNISASWFAGEHVTPHTTRLVVDSGSDGIPDLVIAEDTDGDGTWDVVNSDTDNNGQPDYSVDAGTERAYELVRPTGADQTPMRDPVTLTATATNTTDTDSITATVLLAAVTAAVLTDFDAYAVNGQVVVEWRTSAEVGTIGFDLRRWREGDGASERVNSALVPGLRHIQGGTYRLIDTGVSVGDSVVYRLYERDVWGRGNTFGPFDVTVEERGSTLKTATALAAGVSREVNQSSVRSAAAKSASAGGVPSGLVKILIRDDGLVRLSVDALADALDTDPGVVSDWIADGNLWIATGSDVGPPDTVIFADGFESGDDSLWGAGGKEPNQPEGVAWMAVDGDSALVFWAEAIDSIYTRDNVYWLGVGRGLRMETRPATAIQTKTLGSFPETIHFEQEQWPLTSVMTDPEADFWMWDYFFPFDGEPVVTGTFTVATPGVAPAGGLAHLTVRLQGSYEAEVADNHIVGLRLNGTDFGSTWRWSDHDVLTLDVDFPQGILNDGDNALEITASLADGLDFDEFYLDSIDLGYQRLHVASGDRLFATSGDAPAVTVDGFSDDEILVFDVTNPKTPVALTGVLIEPESNGFSAHFGVSGGSMPFVASTDSAIEGPAALVVDFSSNLRDPANRGRYVVVAGPGLEGEAETLAAYREQQGLSAVVAPVADIFDEFNGGVVSPWAIRDFLRFAYENWAEAPEYVFLAGDGTLDYKNMWGADESLVPAPMTVAHGGLVPSDNSLADWIGDDGVPEIAVGRLPAHTPSEFAAYREKIIAFETGAGDWKQRTVWLADAADEGGEFSADLEDLVEGLPPGFERERIAVDWVGPEAARERTLQSWNRGAVMVQFLGHGALDLIANSGLVTTDDVSTMSNDGRTPMLAALTCMVGRFDIPDYDILSEALLLEDGGGSIGVWSPSAFSMNEDAALLGRFQVETMADGGSATIGDSVRASLEAYVAAGTGDPILPSIFILLGDPATRVDW